MRKVLLIFALLLPVLQSNAQHKDKNMDNKALIIIDIQNDYFEGGTNPLVGSETASVKAKAILDDFRTKDLPIIHIQHIANREGATFFAPNTFGAEIHENVKPIEGEKVIVKHFPNSFRETDLQSYLQENNISQLVVCGMMTSMCVDATVRAAKDLEYECTVISDACAAPHLAINGEKVDAKDVHNAFLAGLAYFYATVIPATDYLSIEK